MANVRRKAQVIDADYISSKVVKTPEGCHLWPRVNDRGYGIANIMTAKGKRQVQMHRFAYELAGGSLTWDAVLHHACGNRACINPEHLEPMSRSDHARKHMNKTINDLAVPKYEVKLVPQLVAV